MRFVLLSPTVPLHWVEKEGDSAEKQLTIDLTCRFDPVQPIMMVKVIDSSILGKQPT